MNTSENAPEKTVLVTGFEPFGNFTANPAAQVVQALDGSNIAIWKVRGLVLPVVFDDAADLLIKTIEKNNPAAVICLGLAANRSTISLERLAVNLDDAPIPDNAGSQPVDQTIMADGPAAYWSTLPVRTMAAALQENAIPATLSLSAGSYVCNHVFYHLMHCLEDKPGTRGGFIHLPPLAEDAGKAAVGIKDMTRAVRLCIRTL